MKYGGFWIRCAAALIDGIILMIPGTILLFLILSRAMTDMERRIDMNEVSAPTLEWTFQIFGALLIWYGLMGLISLLYGALTQSSHMQATFGKKLCGLIVIRSNRQRITFLRSLGRSASLYLSTSVTMFLGFIILAFTNKKQSLHDMMTDTYVVYKKSIDHIF
ncbi:MAG: RDD family protein [Bacillus sp. (in: firmicutes)]